MMTLFADLIRKGQPGPGAVHIASAIGNSDPAQVRRRRKFKPTFGNLPVTIGNAGSQGTAGMTKLAGDGSRLLSMLDETTAHVPFAYDPTALAQLRADQIPRFLGALTDQDSLPVKTMALGDITAVQNRVDPRKVRQWSNGDRQTGRLPVIVRANGKNLIADGHHRLAGAWLRGDDKAKVRFKDIEPVTNVMKNEPAFAWALPLDIRKVEPDLRQVFGWASVVEKDGVPIIDKQGDIIPPWALEPAAYEFVLSARDHGDMHVRTGTGRLIESMVFTADKQKALGVDLGMIGWWTGFQVDCPDLWSAYKRGDRPEFSIGGSAASVELP